MAPKPISPYQPLLLRLLHGIHGVCLILALITALWTYNTYDGRWGRLPVPDYPDMEGIHGTFGLWTLLIFPLFLVYAIHRGQRRLIQNDSWRQLSKFGKPIWWYSLNRLANTLTLLALLFALFSGKMMDEDWLPRGELDHRWYLLHLVSWVVMVGAIALHLLLNARVGGVPLLRSMVSTQIRPKDSWAQWQRQMTHWYQRGRQGDYGALGQWMVTTPQLLNLEIGIMVCWLLAWVFSAF